MCDEVRLRGERAAERTAEVLGASVVARSSAPRLARGTVHLDVEVGHDAGAERLDELDARVDRREILSAVAGIQVLGAHTDHDVATVAANGSPRSASRRPARP